MKTAPVPIAPPQSRISNVIIHGFMPFSGATSAGTEFAEVSEYPAVLPAAIVPEESGVPALPEETAVLPVGTEELPAAAIAPAVRAAAGIKPEARAHPSVQKE